MPAKRTVSEAAMMDWMRTLPKAELHLHLEGTIAPETLVALSQRHDADPLTLAAAQALYNYADFPGFLQAFKAVTERLRTPEDYELITYAMLRDLHQQGEVHAEAYVAVGVVYYWKKTEFEPLFAGMERGRLRAEKEFGISLLWIFDAVRHFGADEAARVFRKAAEMRKQFSSIVGIGIGGDESRGPAELFRELYGEARENGLRLTAHAGEACGPESLWSAINIGAERLGHALTAQQDQDLIETLAQKQIPLEICITSNVRTGCCAREQEHPIRRYFDEGLMVTLNSDDPAMFGSNLLEEYALAHKKFGFTLEHLRELAGNSIEASFLSPTRKLELLRKVEQHPEPVED